MKKPIYLDNQATTPLDPRALEAMMPYWTGEFGNPHSRSHSYGWTAEEATEIAREQVAKVIGADSKEIIFTSGATESNNLALQGLAGFYGDKKKHIISCHTEHKCVLDTLRHLEIEQGFRITYLPVNNIGLIDLKDLENALTDDTLAVSIMAVNNEIGIIQEIAAIGKLCRSRGAFFHTDLAQAFGKMPIDVEAMNIDLASISSHKVYGPKGIGALYIRRRPRVRLAPLFYGGGQERGFRSGTLPTALCVGFGKAAELAVAEMEADTVRIGQLKKKLYDGIMAKIPEVYINGDMEKSLYNNLNLSFSYIEGESMIMAIRDLAVSSGSACTSASLEPSYVLKALGLGDELTHTSIRFGLGRFTTEDEVDRAIDIVVSNVQKLRDMSPLWEMAQEGIDITKVQWDEGH
jgi:cysteine desulfurase